MNLIILNKSTKIWLNYIVGGSISFVLLWSIYRQVAQQANSLDKAVWKQALTNGYFWLCIFLMFINTSLEGCKWYLLTRSVGPVTYYRAFASYLAGVAFSIITPNRIGEYPGRILYLGRRHTFRYINVSVLGIMAQLSAVYIFGFAGLVYYNITFPAPPVGPGNYNGIIYYAPKIALAACGLANIFIAIVYWRFGTWLPLLEKINWMRRFVVYGRLLNRVTAGRQIVVLAISLLRFSIFTAQFLFLLKCMNVGIPFWGGFCMVALFFWIMAVIPSIALTELGVRGMVGIFLFRNFSPDLIGIIAATGGIWLLNLIIPSIIGSILIIRMKLLQ
jgi:hypothetical protein